ncbi:MAG: BTAD domain-containing putative transcriptional regulator, partial [Chloroflexota bacterium]
MTDNLHIDLLTGFRITADGDELPSFRQHRLQALLAYLLLHRDKPQSRQHIAFQFWPDSTEKQARINLRKLIYGVRQSLPQHERFLKVTNSTLQWREDAPATVDVFAFEAHLRAAELSPNQDSKLKLLTTAVNSYQGELLPHLDAEWIVWQRQRLQDRFTTALVQLIELLEGERAYQTAVSYARRLLQIDPFQESTYRLLMRLYLLAGNPASALRIYHSCATLLMDELGVTPSEPTEQLYRQALNLESAPTQEEAPAEQEAKLPLVGRSQEWQTLVDVWQRARNGKAYFALIQGEAGIGKTRLAEEAVEFAKRLGMQTGYSRAYAAIGSSALAPVVELLHTPAVYGRLNQLATVWQTELSRLVPELRTNNPHLKEPLPMLEEWQRRQFFEAISRAIIDDSQPLLLHFDDLQWWDDDAIAWLQFLLEHYKNASLLVIGTVRNNEIEKTDPIYRLLRQLKRRNRAADIVLEPLQAKHTVELVKRLTDDSLSLAEMEALHQETEGSPFYTLEIVRSGQFKRGENRAQSQSLSNNELAPMRSLPDKIEEVIQDRLSQLSDSAQDLVEITAVIGQSFSHPLLQFVSGYHERELVRALDELWRRRIIRERGNEAYDFSHDYIRSIAYHQISPM